MQVDARPFRTLTTPAGSCQCGPPKVNPLSLSVSGPAGGVLRDNATHTITVFAPLPSDLVDNVIAEVEGQRYRVLRNGVDTKPYGAKLYVSRSGPAQQELP